MPHPPVDGVRAAHQAGESWAAWATDRIDTLESALRAARHYLAGGTDDLNHSREETLEYVDAVLRGEAHGLAADPSER